VIPDTFVEMAQAYRLLSALGPAQLRRLLPLAEEQQFDPGRIIFREGDTSAFLHLIVSGEVALESHAGSHAVCVQTLHPGDAMGWSAITADSKTHFQARAISIVSTVSFSGARIREACERDPTTGYALMKKLLDLVTERLDATRLQLARVTIQ
jgi:CRP/FNR family cyclic AMP-dependent transcriptional regulator